MKIYRGGGGEIAERKIPSVKMLLKTNTNDQVLSVIFPLKWLFVTKCICLIPRIRSPDSF